MADSISVLGFADPDASSSNPSDTLKALNQPYEPPTLSDYGRMLGTGVTGLASGLAATGAYFTSSPDSDPVAHAQFSAAQNSLNNSTSDLMSGLTPSAANTVNSSIMSGTFSLQHPLSGALLGAAPMAPALVAAALPAGIVGDALGAVAGRRRQWVWGQDSAFRRLWGTYTAG